MTGADTVASHASLVALEDLVKSLRKNLTRLTLELEQSRNHLEQLQTSASPSRRAQIHHLPPAQDSVARELEDLRKEIERLANEVVRLGGIVELGLGARRGIDENDIESVKRDVERREREIRDRQEQRAPSKLTQVCCDSAVGVEVITNDPSTSRDFTLPQHLIRPWLRHPQVLQREHNLNQPNSVNHPIITSSLEQYPKLPITHPPHLLHLESLTLRPPVEGGKKQHHSEAMTISPLKMITLLTEVKLGMMDVQLSSLLSEGRRWNVLSSDIMSLNRGSRLLKVTTKMRLEIYLNLRPLTPREGRVPIR